MKSTPILLLCCAMQSLAQSSTTASGSATTPSLSQTTTRMDISVEDMWNMWIGAVSMAAVNTTVSPTAVASAELIPPPPQHYASWMRGPQSPAVHANASWRFPRAFWWGVAGASYQVEGAVKDEGRGPSVWDALLHRVEGYSMANETGDVTANHYYYYKQDIARLAALRVPYYSFSISWSRILPFGRGPVNEDGLAHYEDVINTCLEYGVKPAVTLFHWDLPLYLYNLYGGWTSEEIVDDFVEYARIILTRYGNKVPMWYTLNEPISFCTLQMPEHYFKNVTIPKKQQPYFCGQHALLAHSKVYHLAKSLNITGPISLKNNGYYKVARTNSTEDAKAVQRAWDFNEGWFANPIYVDGEYPRYLKEYVGTFLRELTAEEKAQIQNSTDFFAHDAYAAKMYMAPSGGIDACVTNESHALFPTCADSTFTYADEDGGWNIGPAADPYTAWLHKATDWIPQFLHYIQDTWHPAGGIAVTEFGFTEPYEARKWLLGDIRADLGRTTYFHDYLEAVLIALSEGVNVVGCLAWSVFDNLEWTAGFNVQFGLQYVNRTTQQRHYKASFFELARMFETYQEK